MYTTPPKHAPVIYMCVSFPSSRAAVQATAAASAVSVKRKNNKMTLEKAFVGDILLKFRHYPKLGESSGKML